MGKKYEQLSAKERNLADNYIIQADSWLMGYQDGGAFYTIEHARELGAEACKTDSVRNQLFIKARQTYGYDPEKATELVDLMLNNGHLHTAKYLHVQARRHFPFPAPAVDAAASPEECAEVLRIFVEHVPNLSTEECSRIKQILRKGPNSNFTIHSDVEAGSPDLTVPSFLRYRR